MSISDLIEANGSVKTAEEISAIVSGVAVPGKTFFDARSDSIVGIASTLQSERRNPIDTGATGDGATDDKPAIQATIDNMTTGGILFFSPGTYRLESSITFPSSISVEFAAGADLFVTTGNTITMNATVVAPLRFILGGTDTGFLTWGNTSNKEVHPEWFLDYVNDATDFSPAIIRAITSLNTGQTLKLTRVYGLGTASWVGISFNNKDDWTMDGIGRGSGFKLLVAPSQTATGAGSINPVFKLDSCDRFTWRDFDFDSNQIKAYVMSAVTNKDCLMHNFKHFHPLWADDNSRTFFWVDGDYNVIDSCILRGAREYERSATATSTGSSVTLNDSGADFVALGVAQGDIIENLTDGSIGVVLSRGTTSIVLQTPGLEGGSDNIFTSGDTYDVYGIGGGAGYFFGTVGGSQSQRYGKIVNCDIKDSRSPVGGVHQYCVLSGNVIFNSGGSAMAIASGIRQQSLNNTIQGNVIHGTNFQGIQMDVTDQSPAENNTIAENTIKWTRSSGVSMVDSNRCVVNSNNITNFNVDGIGTDVGILCTNLKDTSIMGNVIVDTRGSVAGTSNIGIGVQGTSTAGDPSPSQSNLSIMGNIIKGMSAVGIQLSASAGGPHSDISVFGNVVQDSVQGINQLNGGAAANAVRITLGYNITQNNATHNIRVDSDDTILRGTRFGTGVGGSLLTRSFADGDTTPDISGMDTWKFIDTAPNSVTSFDGGEVGDTKIVFFTTTNTTLVHSAGYELQGSVNFPTVPVGTRMVFTKIDDTSQHWVEVSRSIV